MPLQKSKTQNNNYNFNGPLENAKSNKDPHRTFKRSVMLYVQESSWRERRGRPQGHAKTRQEVYLAMAAVTLQSIGAQPLTVHNGGTKSDVVGPVVLDPLSRIPKLKLADKIEYYGKRRVAPGGKLEDEAENEGAELEDEEQIMDTEPAVDPDETEGMKPINYHVLPITVVTDYVQGFGVKHVIDFTPTPLPLAIALSKLGVSYAAFCATDSQATFLKNQYREALRAELLDPSSVLYESRLTDRKDIRDNAGGGSEGSTPPGSQGNTTLPGEAGTVPPGGRGGGRGRGRGRGSTNAGAGDKGDGAGDKGGGAGDKGDGAGPMDLAALLAEARKNSEEGGAS